MKILETKVDRKFEETKDVIATKDDIRRLDIKIAETRADLIKWMFIFWASQLTAIFAFLKFFK